MKKVSNPSPPPRTRPPPPPRPPPCREYRCTIFGLMIETNKSKAAGQLYDIYIRNYRSVK